MNHGLSVILVVEVGILALAALVGLLTGVRRGP